MRTSVEAALKQAGFPGAQVSSVDCTEYPCIVYADGVGGRDDAAKLLKSPALADYKDDSKFTSCTSGSTKGGPDRRSCGISFTPKDDDAQRRSDLAKRMRYRAEQMAETLK